MLRETAEAIAIELFEPEPKPGEGIAKEVGSKPISEAKPSFKTQLTDLLRCYLGEGAVCADYKALDDDGTIEAAMKDIEQTERIEHAYTQAAHCLTEAEM